MPILPPTHSWHWPSFIFSAPESCLLLSSESNCMSFPDLLCSCIPPSLPCHHWPPHPGSETQPVVKSGLQLFDGLSLIRPPTLLLLHKTVFLPLLIYYLTLLTKLLMQFPQAVLSSYLLDYIRCSFIYPLFFDHYEMGNKPLLKKYSQIPSTFHIRLPGSIITEHLLVSLGYITKD